MMQAFIAPLAGLAEYQEILQKRRKERGFCRSQAVSIHKNTFDVCAWRWFSYKIIVFSSEEKRRRHMKNIAF